MTKMIHFISFLICSSYVPHISYIQTCVKFDVSDANPHWVLSFPYHANCAKFVYAEAKKQDLRA